MTVSPIYEDGRFLPTRVGYECAAFVRYRLPYGADQERRIELYPSWQWGWLVDEPLAHEDARLVSARAAWRRRIARRK